MNNIYCLKCYVYYLNVNQIHLLFKIRISQNLKLFKLFFLFSRNCASLSDKAYPRYKKSWTYHPNIPAVADPAQRDPQQGRSMLAVSAPGLEDTQEIRYIITELLDEDPMVITVSSEDMPTIAAVSSSSPAAITISSENVPTIAAVSSSSPAAITVGSEDVPAIAVVSSSSPAAISVTASSPAPVAVHKEKDVEKSVALADVEAGLDEPMVRLRFPQ